MLESMSLEESSLCIVDATGTTVRELASPRY